MLIKTAKWRIKNTVIDPISYAKKQIKLRRVPKFVAGRFVKTETPEQGVRNYVFKVITNRGSFYIKQYLPTLKNFPIQTADPKRINDERTAISLLSKILSQRQVPKIYYVDHKTNCLLLSDVRRTGILLEDAIDADSTIISHSGIETLAQLIFRLHMKTKNTKHQIISQEKDREKFNKILKAKCFDVCSKVDRTAKQTISETLSKQHWTSIIHGSLCPKNLFLNGSQITLIDFERSCRGDPAFDIGYFSGHLMLYSVVCAKSNPAKSRQLIELSDIFLNTYMNYLLKHSASEMVDCMKNRVETYIGTTMLYRVDGASKSKQVTSEPLRQMLRDVAMTFITHESSTGISKGWLL